MTDLMAIENISFNYEESPILQDVTLTIRSGEVLGIIGPNGSGKTTLLRLLTGILHPRQGRILLEGKDLKQWKRKELTTRIAVVPQDTYIPFTYTVSEIVLMGRTPYLHLLEVESKHDFEIAGQMMQLTDTLEFSDRYFDALSGGEKQRVLIARALVQEPDILLLDEPTAHLDINHQIDILNLVKKLNREKQVAVVLVTHDLNTASLYTDRLMLLSKGQRVALGVPAEVITQDNIRNVYGTEVLIHRHPTSGVPQVILPMEGLVTK